MECVEGNFACLCHGDCQLRIRSIVQLQHVNILGHRITRFASASASPRVSDEIRIPVEARVGCFDNIQKAIAVSKIDGLDARAQRDPRPLTAFGQLEIPCAGLLYVGFRVRQCEVPRVRHMQIDRKRFTKGRSTARARGTSVSCRACSGRFSNTNRRYAWCEEARPAALIPPKPTITGNKDMVHTCKQNGD